jgi:hypothetical protein
MRGRPLLLGLVALALSLGGAACGSSNGNGVASQSPDQAVQTALAAFRSAKSVTVSGDIGTGSTSTTIDGVIFDNGDFNGTIGVNGTSAKLIKIGDTDYLEGAEGFWQGNGMTSTQAAEVANKWIEIPDSQMGLGNTLSIPTLASQFTNHGTLSAGTTGTVEGQAAVSIVSSKGGTLWIATTGTAYPLELQTQKQGAIYFSDYNASTVPTAPAGAVPESSLGASSTGTTGTGTTGTPTTVPDNTGATGTGGTGGGTSVTTLPGTTGGGSTVTTSPSTTGAGTTGTTAPGTTGTGTDTTST